MLFFFYLKPISCPQKLEPRGQQDAPGDLQQTADSLWSRSSAAEDGGGLLRACSLPEPTALSPLALLCVPPKPFLCSFSPHSALPPSVTLSPMFLPFSSSPILTASAPVSPRPPGLFHTWLLFLLPPSPALGSGSSESPRKQVQAPAAHSQAV